jgi:DNA-directed RNA polymerase specialized sigma24 family protein
MTIGAEVAAHLPFLRRYARALTGSQHTGDAFVQATLEAALADRDLAETLRGGRVPLYRAFNKVWSSA